MKATLFALVLSISVGAFAALGAPGAQAQQNVCKPNPSPVDSSDPSIIVTAPAAGASVSSPIHVAGQARVFEATVSLTLYDANGAEIVSTTTNAAEGQVLSAFSTDVAFSVATPASACLWVFEVSARDGSPVNVVQVPLTLSAAGLPSTGSGGEGSSGRPIVWLFGGLAVAGVAVAAGAWLRIRHVA